MNVLVAGKSEQLRLDEGTRMTCLSLAPDESWALVGDAQGGLHKVDLCTGNVF